MARRSAVRPRSARAAPPGRRHLKPPPHLKYALKNKNKKNKKRIRKDDLK